MSGLNIIPLFPWPLVAVLLATGLLLSAVVAVRGGCGAILRALVLLTLAAALLDPRIVREQRQPRDDVALIIVDDSPSQHIGDRRAQRDAALAKLKDMLQREPDLETRIITVNNNGHTDQTNVFSAIERELTPDLQDRLAAVLLLTDGQIHDVPKEGLPNWLSGPVHVLLTGSESERDRRLIVEAAPAYGLVGSRGTISFRIDDLGPPPPEARGAAANVSVRIDGKPGEGFDVPIGVAQQMSFPVSHAGPNVIEIEAAGAPDEVSQTNNYAALKVNGIRDRLRVLLVSGQPHLGERTWRNLLKSDPAVDLIHFTILRPPEKHEATPLNELSLIVFPVQELFEQRIQDFDLLVFDRYVLRGVLTNRYFERIAQYLEEGGAILVSAGPEFASQSSLYQTPLGRYLPAHPTGRIIEGEFRPQLTDIGRHHPVTSGLPGEMVAGDAGTDDVGVGPVWGPWYRVIEADGISGHVLMQGAGGEPVLILNRVGQGRIALLTSDQIWLWARGYQGGGPQGELLRRLAHWLMREPELEEEQLTAHIEDGRLSIERRSLGDPATTVTVTTPQGQQEPVELEFIGDGIARANVEAKSNGVYRVEHETQSTVAVSSRRDGKEFSDFRATADLLKPFVNRSGGRIAWLSEGLPNIRRTAPGRDSAGHDWIGLQRNRDYVVMGTAETPLLPALLLLALALGSLGGAWWREAQ
ncbi:MAG: hypothetical protein H6905_06530 [Hyphomicrobiales bacterium]|nr:hypothetical protein [Hyphomicrobiales bacterium]